MLGDFGGERVGKREEALKVMAKNSCGVFYL
jgi:hypothetical protein